MNLEANGRDDGTILGGESAPDVSVVIATFNRIASLERLLGQLALQQLPPARFEVVVIDDGSTPPAGPALAARRQPYALQVEAQPNSGAAAARHRGAGLARGRILVFVDDDMQLEPDFLANHLALHDRRPRPTVVLGQIEPDAGLADMPLFERYHARMLALYATNVRAGTRRPQGTDLCTGNVSMRRADYLAVGGFDPAFERSEDAELGVRLQKAGVDFAFSEAAHSFHGSDHTELETWRGRAYRYGIHDLRLARKHPELGSASPFRFLREVNPLSRPFLLGALLVPRPGAIVARGILRAALGIDRIGLEGLAVRAMTLVYGMEYFRGIRAEEGGALAALVDGIAHLRGHRGRGPLRQLWSDIEADHAMLRHYEAKYHQRTLAPTQLRRDLVEKIGFQMLACYRLMRALRAANQPLAAKLVSRVIRHAYGSDIHWDAEFEPGILVVHGMGMAISHSAKVARGSILNHHVTLGDGTDPLTRATGAPSLGAEVHVGPGATLVGPIHVGAHSKIMPGALLMRSVPEGSLVSVPTANVEPRVTSRGPRALNGDVADV